MRYNIIIIGLRFDWLLCDVYADSLAEARREARKHVEPGEKWILRRAA